MAETIDLKTWQDRINQLRQWQPATPELWSWLRDINNQMGCGPATIAAIEELNQGGVAVVTGQQAGLLTGPLYTIYKATSAIILARDLKKKLGVPVVPVFWLASEDHDFLEVRSAWLPAGDKLEQVVFPGEYQLTPAAEIPLSPADIILVTERLRELLPVTDFTEEVLALVSEAATGTFSHWCGSLLSRIFREHGLVIVDSCGLPVRQAAIPVFTQAIQSGPAIHRLLAEKGADFMAAGRTPPLAVPPDHSHLFLLHQGQRLGLLWDGERFRDRNNIVTLTPTELFQLAETEPWKLSPNVVLRPLVQERVLPVLAIIGGPGELAYLQQMEQVFTLMGLSQPPVLPRMGGVLLEPPVARLLEKYGLRPGQVAEGLDEWGQERLRQGDPVGIESAFAQLRSRIEKGYADIQPGLEEIDGQLGDLATKNLGKVLDQVHWLQKRAEAIHRQRNSELLMHIRKLETALAPGGKEQERIHNCLWYFNRYGLGVIDTLLQQDWFAEFELSL